MGNVCAFQGLLVVLFTLPKKQDVHLGIKQCFLKVCLF